jgi:DNA-binding MarR family transcriptional regulator
MQKTAVSRAGVGSDQVEGLTVVAKAATTAQWVDAAAVPSGDLSPCAGGPGTCHDDLGWLLARAAHVVGSAVERQLEVLGLGKRGFIVLKAAAGLERATQRDIARAVGIDKTTLVQTIDQLEAAGLCERRPDPRDRRARLVVPTAAGTDRIAWAEAVVRDLEAELLEDLDDHDARDLRRLLTQLVSTEAFGGLERGSCV